MTMIIEVMKTPESYVPWVNGEKTGWFRPEVQPVRSGAYQTVLLERSDVYLEGMKTLLKRVVTESERGWSWYDAPLNRWYDQHPTFELAAFGPRFFSQANRERRWRGITESEKNRFHDLRFKPIYAPR